MKALMIAVSFVAFAGTGLAQAAGTAPAAGTQATAGWNGSSARDAQVRIRAQVRDELVQAQRSGQLAYLRGTLYKGS